MRVPLDYYRILGLPPNFFQPMSAEQLQQAYRDRTAQLPQREYTLRAIDARNRLISLAYHVLSDPQQRQHYDAEYRASADELANSMVVDGDIDDGLDVPHKIFDRNFDHNFETSHLSIEIADDLLVGALTILQDAGECELVLNLGRAFLSTIDLDEDSAAKGDRPDVVLAVALAYLQQGREQWQNDQYENAAAALQTGYKLLEQEGLFPDAAAEIAADLEKLRPYRILELVSQPESHVAERQRGLQLLQDILRDRQGIDGAGNDGSGLSIEDFLGFIQQVRDYLTAAEQQSLFEAESQRPSAVATYLAVYASIARGFAARMPALIRQAKFMLLRLGKRQDLYLEQAICSLLLGQTVEATEALQHSQEHEPLAAIRKNSQGAPDLLPGLCLYSEKWLQTEVFPHFRDLATQKASLKDYFADPDVQAYLEALPSQPDHTIEEYQMVVPADRAVDNRVLDNSERVTARNGQQAIAANATTARGAFREHGEPLTPNSSPLGAVAVLSNPEQTTAANTTSGADKAAPSRSRRKSKNRPSRGGNGKTRSIGALDFGFKRDRLALLLLGGTLGIAFLWFLISQIFGFFHRATTPPVVQSPVISEQLIVELNQPPLAIPQLPKKPAPPEPLNRNTAAPVVQSWLAAKAAAFGKEHNTDKLKQILVEPALSQWQKRVQDDLLNRRVRHYKHSLQVNGVKNDPKTSDRAQVEATVVEVAQVYERNRLNRAASYNEKLRVQYNVVRQNGQWRIQTMKVLK